MKNRIIFPGLLLILICINISARDNHAETNRFMSYRGLAMAGYQSWFNCEGDGATMLYVAIFEEVNEGTAIFKCCNTPSVSNVAKFIGMDGNPSDHYSILLGEAGKNASRRKALDIYNSKTLVNALFTCQKKY
jgi:hypothetical protein